MALKVAVIGMAESSRHLIPWGSDFELWGLGFDAERYRYDRVFEMHDKPDLQTLADFDSYWEKLAACAKVYMHDAYEGIPGAIRFPFEEVAKTCGEYWESSIAYALSLAIHEGAEEISILGVNMRADEEYAYQLPNCTYLIGFARGKGIKVNIPEESPLLKFSGFSGYDGRYGRLA